MTAIDQIPLGAKLYGRVTKDGYKSSTSDTIHYLDEGNARTFCGKQFSPGQNGWTHGSQFPDAVPFKVNCSRCIRGANVRDANEGKIVLEDVDKGRRDELIALEKSEIVKLAVKLGIYANTTSARTVRKDELIKEVIRTEKGVKSNA